MQNYSNKLNICVRFGFNKQLDLYSEYLRDYVSLFIYITQFSNLNFS
jgi:hypothetical protein